MILHQHKNVSPSQLRLNPTQVRDRLNMKTDARLLFSVHREQREAEKEGAELLPPLIL